MHCFPKVVLSCIISTTSLSEHLHPIRRLVGHTWTTRSPPKKTHTSQAAGGLRAGLRRRRASMRPAPARRSGVRHRSSPSIRHSSNPQPTHCASTRASDPPRASQHRHHRALRRHLQPPSNLSAETRANGRSLASVQIRVFGPPTLIPTPPGIPSMICFVVSPPTCIHKQSAREDQNITEKTAGKTTGLLSDILRSEDQASAGVPRVWLFGGSPPTASNASVALCAAASLPIHFHHLIGKTTQNTHKNIWGTEGSCRSMLQMGLPKSPRKESSVMFTTCSAPMAWSRSTCND